MSYSANQYNYATPLSSTIGLIGATSVVNDTKYFSLFDNVLDGSYYPVSDDVGVWGASLSDEHGVLTEPYILTITDNLSVTALRLTGSQYCYPVAFTVVLYNGAEVLYTFKETANYQVEYTHYLPSMVEVTSCVVTVTKVSQANSVVRLYNVYNPMYIKRTDSLHFMLTEDSVTSQQAYLKRLDKLMIKSVEPTSYMRNMLDVRKDNLVVDAGGTSKITNVHSIMKEPTRRIYGKVYVTYTDPMLDSETSIVVSSEAYGSSKEQLLDSITDVSFKNYFTLYDNNLAGDFIVNGVDSQIGWVSAELSDSDGRFAVPQSVTVNFSARPIVNLLIVFDDSRGNLVKDFSVTFTKENGDSVTQDYFDNANKSITVATESIADVVSITVTVSRVALPNRPAIILDIPVSSTVLYRGYEDVSDLISIDLLEELTYADDVEALGGVSANEVTVILDNSTKAFTGSSSIVSRQLRRNRKIVPWLGVEVIPGEIEWYTLGTFWSYRWDVPVNGLSATVVGFDTIGLLDLTSYINHQVQLNKSIGELVEYVLDDARQTLSFIKYTIDEALYDIIIPYAWFEHDSHTAALRKISLCYPMHIYCDRQGRICVAPQRLRLDHYFDIWSDNTNVIDKTYSSLYTTLPNIVSVKVYRPVILNENALVEDTTSFLVLGNGLRTLNFSNPYISDINVNIECDDTLSYEYEVYSWGIIINFLGTGTVHSVTCTGYYVDISNSSIVTMRDENSIRLNGAVTRDVESSFIQTNELAESIINRLKSLSEYDKYDATVNYRGDIALSINDPILLEHGIAPDNRYNIRRHQLSWNGALTGSADLNT